MSDFSKNFSIYNQRVPYDSVLTRAGNDFMCVKLQDDTIHTTWGDTRSGNLNIWYARIDNQGKTLNTVNLAKEYKSPKVYPNPTNGWLTINGNNISEVKIYDVQGRLVSTKHTNVILDKNTVDITHLPKGHYTIQVKTEYGTKTQSIIKK